MKAEPPKAFTCLTSQAGTYKKAWGSDLAHSTFRPSHCPHKKICNPDCPRPCYIQSCTADVTLPSSCGRQGFLRMCVYALVGVAVCHILLVNLNVRSSKVKDNAPVTPCFILYVCLPMYGSHHADFAKVYFFQENLIVYTLKFTLSLITRQ